MSQKSKRARALTLPLPGEQINAGVNAGGHAATEGELSDFCPRYHHAVELIGRRWTGVILRMLLRGPRRFNELLTAIPGLSDRLLTDRLRELESTGLVVRRVLSGPPVRVEYELTAQGQDLGESVRAISIWAEKWLPGVKVAPP